MYTMQAHGAYGRIANIADWHKGLDFYSMDHSKYFSKRDNDMLKSLGYIQIDFYRGANMLFSVSL